MEVNLKTILLILSILILIGCSNGGGSSSSPSPVVVESWNSFSVVSQSDLPTCSGDIVGRLYYVESTSLFQVCKSSGWTTVNVKGTDGTNGTNGLTISSIKYCSKTTGGATFKNNIVTFSTGDKHIYCEISNSLNTYSASIFYRSVQTGATTESCLIVYDIDTATAGFWNFALSGSTRAATYSDSGSASNGTVITYASGDCATSP